MMEPYKIPTKQPIDREVMDAAINQAVEAGSFTVEIVDGDKSTSIQFKRFLHPIEKAIYRNQVADRALVHDTDNGCLMVDDCSLTLTTHAFIFSFLSTMPELAVERETDGTLGDAATIGTYGDFLMTASKEYREVFESLFEYAIDYCQVKISNHNEMLKVVYKNMDMKKIATSPEVLEIMKSAVLELDKSKK